MLVGMFLTPAWTVIGAGDGVGGAGGVGGLIQFTGRSPCLLHRQLNCTREAGRQHACMHAWQCTRRGWLGALLMRMLPSSSRGPLTAHSKPPMSPGRGPGWQAGMEDVQKACRSNAAHSRVRAAQLAQVRSSSSSGGGGGSSSSHLGHDVELENNAAGVDPLVEFINKCRGARIGWRKQHSVNNWRPACSKTAVEVRLRSIGQEAAHSAAQEVASDENLGDLGGRAGG